jgi:flagellar M-ring protein FliF
VLTGEIDDGNYLPADLPMISGLGMAMPMGAADFDDGAGAGDPVARLKKLIGERQEESVEILRSWMQDQEGRA